MAALLLAGACSVLPPQAEPPALYVIDATPAATKAPGRVPQTLEVAPIRAAPGCDTPAMMYSTTPHALEAFALHRWADAPARMLTPQLVRALDDASVFTAVVPGPSPVAADWRLDVELLRLQQDFTVRPSRADVALRVQLVDLRTRRVVATRYVETTAPAAADDPKAGVVAVNAAVREALGMTVAFVTQAAGGR
ncbi:MAG: ABC-type transport auxiliary lipoprotein family protein [Burkholderiales bacterium]